jgi:SAM-dependent methyltransferase
MIDLYARIEASSGNSYHDAILNELETVLPDRGRLLDFGCGPGYLYERALQRGWDAHGYDAGPWMAHAAAQRGLPNMHVGVLADQGFPEGHFDVICANQVLEHLADPKDELAQLLPLLQPGGVFFASVPNYRCLSIVLGRDDFELNAPPQHVNYFTPKTMRMLVEGSGFKIIRISTSSGLKWENLFGRRIHSGIADAYREHHGRQPAKLPPSPPSPGRPSRLKRLVFPLVKTIFYRMAKVGFALEVIARKP